MQFSCSVFLMNFLLPQEKIRISAEAGPLHLGPRIVQDPPKEHSEVKGIQISGKAARGRVSDQGLEPCVRRASLLVSRHRAKTLWTDQVSMEILKIWEPENMGFLSFIHNFSGFGFNSKNDIHLVGLDIASGILSQHFSKAPHLFRELLDVCVERKSGQ